MVSKKNWALAILGVFLMGLIVAAVISDQVTANNSKENKELAAGEVISAEYQDNSPDDHALPQSHYNTDYLELWCGEPYGTIYMVGGWYYSEGFIETETRDIWEVNTDGINEWECLLVWFDDMGTPDNHYDDQIIKIWSEVYD